MPDDQFAFIKTELQSVRLDMADLKAKIETMGNSLKNCQSRCHVPGPPPSFRSMSKLLVDRFIEKYL